MASREGLQTLKRLLVISLVAAAALTPISAAATSPTTHQVALLTKNAIVKELAQSGDGRSVTGSRCLSESASNYFCVVTTRGRPISTVYKGWCAEKLGLLGRSAALYYNVTPKGTATSSVDGRLAGSHARPRSPRVPCLGRAHRGAGFSARREHDRQAAATHPRPDAADGLQLLARGLRCLLVCWRD